MKFLLFGDLHRRQKPPVSRIDDWSQTIKNKIAEIQQIATTHNVTALLEPGDFLDSPKISDEFLNDILLEWSNQNSYKLILQFMSGELKADELMTALKKEKPLVGIIGNHEIFGHSIKAFNKTSLNLLQQIGFINLVTKDNPLFFKSEDGFTVAITGSNYHADIDRDPSHKDYIVEQKLGDFHIHIVHGYGTILDFGDLMPHTKIQELGNTQADLTFIGHDHIGFDPIEVNGKWFVNPGAPVRLSNDTKEMARIPKVMIIDVDKNGIKFDAIPLKSALNSSLVLDRTKIEMKAEQQQKLDEIKETIKNANVGKGDNIIEIVENIANTRNLPDEMKTTVRELIAKKAENLVTTTKTPANYYIKSLELTNFQSHEHSFFEFSEGLNVLTGESRSGKTSIMRAFGWIYEDYGGAARRFIKTGAKSAEATIVLSNGYIITRIVELKSNGFNGYKVFHPDKQEWESMNTKAIAIVQEILGFAPLQIDKTDSGKVETIPLNFLRQGNSWFFIGDDTTGSQRAKIIGTICGTNVADAAIREVEAKNKELALLTKNLDKEIHQLEIDMGCMTHIEKMEEAILLSDKLIEELADLLQKKEFLESNKKTIDSIKEQAQVIKLVETELKEINKAKQVVTEMIALANQKEIIEDKRIKLVAIQKDSANLELVLKNLEPVKKAQEMIAELIILADTKSTIKRLSDDSNALIKTGTLLKKFMQNIPDTEVAKNELSALKELHEKKMMIQSYGKDLVENEKQQKNLGLLVTNLTNVNTARNIIQDIVSFSEQKRIVLDYKKNIDAVNKDILLEEKNSTECDQQIKSVKLEYMDVFKHVDKCPLCLHDITREDAISIAKNKFTKES